MRQYSLRGGAPEGVAGNVQYLPEHGEIPMILPRLEQLEDAAGIVGSGMRPTPEICWPALSERSGTEGWVKHENHTPVGAFKLRGGRACIHDLGRSNHPPK